MSVNERSPSRRKPFFIGLILGVVCGLALGSTLAAIFGDDVVVLIQKVVKRITGEREEPNFQILLQ
jgi:hypothetical protein